MKNLFIILFCIALLSLLVVSNANEFQRVDNAVFHAGYGFCERCGKTWDVVTPHDTEFGPCVWYVTTPSDTNAPLWVQGAPNDGKTHRVVVTNGEGCFPLCEKCWQALTPQTRLPYYRRLLDEWDKEDGNGTNYDAKWQSIKTAVLAGK